MRRVCVCGLKLLIKFIYYPIFTNRRLEYLKKMLSGLFVGLFRYGLKKQK